MKCPAHDEQFVMPLSHCDKFKQQVLFSVFYQLCEMKKWAQQPFVLSMLPALAVFGVFRQNDKMSWRNLGRFEAGKAAW
jgi:hypothetical protein